ncbi:MAG TPA: ABC transporter substrate-binding protein [Limnochordales bacterium]
MGGSVDALEGLTREIQADQFKGKLWASARYIHNWPDTEMNRRFVEAFQNRWARLPNYSAESAYSAIYIAKAAIEKARSLETDAIIAALQDMVIETPAGTRVFRNYDHQFEYAVPAGRAMWDPAYPIATLGDLRVFDTSEYWRYPPFEPLQ